MNFPADWSSYITENFALLGPASSFICSTGFMHVALKLLPYLGNGYIGTQPNSPWIFMDGLFNGPETTSHRACIPSPIRWKISSVELGNSEEISWNEQLWMHYGMGLFTQRFLSDTCEVCCSTFVSRKRPTLLVRYLFARFYTSESASSLIAHVDGGMCLDSPDCTLDISYENGRRIDLHGFTHSVESVQFQRERLHFFMSTDVVAEELVTGFHLTPNSPYRCFLTSISRVSIDNAIAEYNAAFNLSRESPECLLYEQASAWLHLWQTGFVQLTMVPDSVETAEQRRSTSQLPLMIQAAQYSLLTCFPSPAFLQPSFTNGSDCSFFGLSPTGLSRGNEEDDYMGHVFWDMEMWMLPWVNLFQPDLCQLALNYRYATLGVAQKRAIAVGLQGARFPWESAFTGIETTPWKLAADNQIHVVGSVSHAVQQWLIAHCLQQSIESITDCRCDSREWYEVKGKILLENVARFWYSRMTYNPKKECFEIADVMPPDEYTHCCKNSAYTNAIAASSLVAPAQLARLFDAPILSEYRDWEAASRQLWMPRDYDNHIMLEHEDYVLGTCVKQADTILLKYPLLYEQPEQWEKNMLEQYASVTDPNGPAMTWSIFCICALELKDDEHALEYFERNLLHVKDPFFNWTELANGEGAANFLTGAGGFLQSILHGFAGIRTRLLKHRVIDESCCNPSHFVPALYVTPRFPKQLLTQWRSLRLNNIHFHACRLTVDICLKDRGYCTLTLVSGIPLRVGYKVGSSWIFGGALSAQESVMVVHLGPLCVVPNVFDNRCSLEVTEIPNL